MIRWTYIFPRLMIVALIGLAIWIGRDLIVKNAIVQSFEDVTGAKVDVGQIRTSWNSGKVILKDLRLADPRNPMVNLFQSEMTIVELDLEKLWNREFVVKSGKTTNIQLGAPRTESGFLRPVMQQSPMEPALVTTQFARQDLEQNWLDSLVGTSTDLTPYSARTSDEARRIDQKWSRRFAAVATEIEQLNQLRSEADTQLEKHGIIVRENNPLRQDDSQFVKANEQVLRIQKKIRGLANTYSQLEKQRRQDIQELMEVARGDANSVMAAQPPISFDADKISKLLLTDVEHQSVVDVVDWFRWFRNNIPNPDTDFAPRKRRGVDVPFGTRQRSGFLIESLEFEGEGRFAGQHIDFFGNLKNLSATPKGSAAPCEFNLRAQGNQPVLIHCVLDRRTDEWRDKLKVTSNGLPSSLRILGTDETLKVAVVGDPKLFATIEIETMGDQIRGSISLQHVGLQLHVEKIHELAGGESAVLRLNQMEIPTISEFTTRIELSGTFNAPTYQVSSELGHKFASALEKIVKMQSEQERQEALVKLNENNAQLVAKLDEKLQGYLATVGSELQAKQSSYAQLIQRVAELKRDDDPFRR